MNTQTSLKHTESPKTVYPNLDIAKFVMAFLVILIHARPFAGIFPIADFLISDVAARVAVPVYFAISGFLFFRKLEYENGKAKWSAANRMYLIQYLKRIGLIYLAWSAVYIVFRLPYWYQIGWWGLAAIKDCVANLFLAGSHYHTWFLLSLIYGVPLLFCILLVCPRKKLPLLMAAGWCVECMVYSYTWAIPGLQQSVGLVAGRAPIVFDTLFRALPLLGIGVMLSDDASGTRKSSGGLCLCAMAACATEAALLKVFSPNQSNFSYLIFTPCVAYLMLRYLVGCRQIKIPSRTAAVLREASLIIYCLHPMVIEILAGFGMKSGVYHSITVMALSAAFSVSWVLLRRMRRR